MEKPLNNGYDEQTLLNNLIEPEKPDYEIQYEILKEDFEKSNFKVLTPLLYATINSQGELILKNKNDFCNAYENLKFKYENEKGEEKEKQFINVWLKDEKMRTYEKIDFLPGQTVPPNIYNTFKGFKAEKQPLIKSNVEESLIWYHIKHIVCDNNESLLKYFLRWLARLLKKPSDIKDNIIFIKRS